MFLDRIVLDWPYQEDRAFVERAVKGGSSREKAMRADYAEHWRDKRKRFAMLTDCMAFRASALMGDVRTSGYHRLAVACVSPGRPPAPVVADGICTSFVEFDPTPLFHASDGRIKEAAILLIEEGADLAEAATGDDLAVVRAACRQIREEGFPERWEWGAAESGDLTAAVHVAYGVSDIAISLTLVNMVTGAREERLVLRSATDVFDLERKYLGNLRWESPDTVALTAPSGFRYALAARR